MRLKPRSIRLRRGAVRIVLAGVCALALLVGIIWLLPIVLTRTDSPISAKDLLDARNSVRVTLLQALGGLLLAIGLVFTERTFRLNREGQVTDRYSKAIEQLGNSSVDVRIGGVYALERIARDSRSDYGTITEVLCAFIREHTSEPSERGRSALSGPAGADVQAAITVLARRHADDEDIDLSNSGLNNLMMQGLWHRARFNYCRIADTIFTRSAMEGVSFSFSHVKVSGFNHISARGASFVHGKVQAWFVDADLRDADFYGCNLTGSDFSARYDESKLMMSKPARLAGSRFTLANLTDVDLTGVDLSEVRGMTEGQLAQAITDAHTIPPTVFADEPVRAPTPHTPAPD